MKENLKSIAFQRLPRTKGGTESDEISKDFDQNWSNHSGSFNRLLVSTL